MLHASILSCLKGLHKNKDIVSRVERLRQAYVTGKKLNVSRLEGQATYASSDEYL